MQLVTVSVSACLPYSLRLANTYLRVATEQAHKQPAEKKALVVSLTSVDAGVNHGKVVWWKQIFFLVFQLRLLRLLLGVSRVPCRAAAADGHGVRKGRARRSR